MIRDLGPDTPVADVVRRARAQGRAVAVVPAAASKQATLGWFAEELHLPAWFGGNLDALAECLHDLAGSEPPDGGSGRLLVWDGVRVLRDADPTAYEGIREVLAEVSDEHPTFEVVVLDR